MDNIKRNWYAIYTMFHHEKMVGELLNKKDIETFVPLRQEVHIWKDRKKKIEKVVIPMMIFVHIDIKDKIKVLSTPSVSRFLVLKGESTPAVIPDAQMDSFRFMLGHSPGGIDFSEHRFAVGERVRVSRGPLMGLEGELMKIDNKSRIFVRLNLLGCVSTEIDSDSLELINCK